MRLYSHFHTSTRLQCVSKWTLGGVACRGEAKVRGHSGLHAVWIHSSHPPSILCCPYVTESEIVRHLQCMMSCDCVIWCKGKIGDSQSDSGSNVHQQEGPVLPSLSDEGQQTSNIIIINTWLVLSAEDLKSNFYHGLTCVDFMVIWGYE